MKTILPVLIAMLLAAGGFAPALAAEPETTVIPVVVNIYNASGADEDRIKAAVKEANKIFAASKAGIQLAIVKTNTLNAAQSKDPGGDDGTSDDFNDGVASDAKFTSPERTKARKYGGKEIAAIEGKKGTKFSFALQPTAHIPRNPGVTAKDDPTILVKDQNDAGKTGATMAHELCHLLGLQAGHKIDADNDADRFGHADPDVEGKLGKGNLMAPSDVRNGTHLTPDQLAVIKKNALKYGWCTKQFQKNFPAVKLAQGFGRSADGAELAAVPGLYDISEVLLTSAGGPFNSPPMEIEGMIRLESAPSPGQPVDATYTLGFNTDANPGTGMPHGGLSGVDRVVRLRVQGTMGSAFTTFAFVEGTASGSATLLPPPELSFGQEYPQEVPSGTAQPFISTILKVKVPVSLLGLSAPVVPVVATSTQGASPMWDTAVFAFHQYAGQERPTVQTYGNGVPTPGSPYPFSLSGLTPGSPFTLYLDDVPVASGTLDGSGGINGAILIPAGLSTADPHFLVAQDGTGRIASGMTCPVW